MSNITVDLPRRFMAADAIPVDAVQVPDVLEIITIWKSQSQSQMRWLSSTNIHTVAQALRDPVFRDAINRADLSIPDGVPLLWLGRWLGFDLPNRCGIEEVMHQVFENSVARGWSHYFYGNTPEVLQALQASLSRRYPGLAIAGSYSPPFRAQSLAEDKFDVARIRETKPDFLWVSLGCPKQELWLAQHATSLPGLVGGGAGAVFDFMSGQKKKAPPFIQQAGLEWALRLCTEPRRLHKRYLRLYPHAVRRVITAAQHGKGRRPRSDRLS